MNNVKSLVLKFLMISLPIFFISIFSVAATAGQSCTQKFGIGNEVSDSYFGNFYCMEDPSISNFKLITSSEASTINLIKGEGTEFDGMVFRKYHLADGTGREFFLDTGASHSEMNAKGIEFDFRGSAQTVTGYDEYLYSYTDIRFAGLHFDNFVLVDEDTRYLNNPVSFGVDFINAFESVCFDFTDMVLSIDCQKLDKHASFQYSNSKTFVLPLKVDGVDYHAVFDSGAYNTLYSDNCEVEWNIEFSSVAEGKTIKRLSQIIFTDVEIAGKKANKIPFLCVKTEGFPYNSMILGSQFMDALEALDINTANQTFGVKFKPGYRSPSFWQRLFGED